MQSAAEIAVTPRATHFESLGGQALARVAKRVFDMALAAVLLALCSPILVVVAALIRLMMGAPVLFTQTRVGLEERHFRIVKFRTMQEDASGLLDETQRLTPLGGWLRRTSLDELPQLWNVLRGEMSLVGPRPLLTRYQPYFRPSERLRFTVLPGITGWAQVRGRNTLSWDERLQYDVWYVEHWSPALDLYILALTLRKVILHEGVQVAPGALMLDLDQERSGVSPSA